LSIAVLFIWQTIFPPVDRSVVSAPEEIESIEGQPAPATDSVVSTGVVSGAESDASAAPGVEAGDTTSAAELVPQVEKVANSEETLVLEARDFRATFSNRGGELTSFRLWRHEETGGDLVDLVQARSAGRSYPLGFVQAADGGEHPLAKALFVATRSTDSEGNESLVFEYRGPAGSATKEFSVTPAGEIVAHVEAEGSWAILWGPGLRNLPEGVVENRFGRRTVVWRQDGDVDREDVSGFRDVFQVEVAGLDWVGLDDTYFLSAVAPKSGLREVAVYPMVHEDGALRRVADGEKVEKRARREAEIVLVPEARELSFTAFLGTKEVDRLADLPHGFSDAAPQTGFLGAIVWPLQIGLRWIHAHVIQNWGWAIVLLTFVIKVALFPLTQKSMVSMARMQEVNPKIQAIRGKFKPKLKDKQGRPNADAQRKMNEEIMLLYKSEGVNPASGCLPMLVQLPIFFALFRLLGSAIELRNAPWVFWIKDLSVADPLFVLPVLMGASQMLQQKMTPMSGDPMQRRLMTIMPIMFVVFAFTFPAGLVLYWLTSNLLTIVQNSLYKRWKNRGAEAA